MVMCIGRVAVGFDILSKESVSMATLLSQLSTEPSTRLWPHRHVQYISTGQETGHYIYFIDVLLMRI